VTLDGVFVIVWVDCRAALAVTLDGVFVIVWVGCFGLWPRNDG